jgi:hypothetical protein
VIFIKCFKVSIILINPTTEAHNFPSFTAPVTIGAIYQASLRGAWLSVLAARNYGIAILKATRFAKYKTKIFTKCGVHALSHKNNLLLFFGILFRLFRLSPLLLDSNKNFFQTPVAHTNENSAENNISL